MLYDRDRFFYNVAIMKARRLLTEQPLYLDTETTGLGSKDQVIEIALIDSEGQDVFYSLIKPSVQITQGAYTVHGITMHDLTEAPTFDQVYEQFVAAVQGRTVIAYNASFDTKLLRQTANAYNLIKPFDAFPLQATCAMLLYAPLAGEWDMQRKSYRWQSLAVALHQCGLKVDEACHRARADAHAARLLMQHIATLETISMGESAENV